MRQKVLVTIGVPMLLAVIAVVWDAVNGGLTKDQCWQQGGEVMQISMRRTVTRLECWFPDGRKVDVD